VPELPRPKPRSPLRIAVITFGAVVLIGTLVSFAVYGIDSHGDAELAARATRARTGTGILGVICAFVAYLTQLKKGQRR
jgi:hypothetical protein